MSRKLSTRKRPDRSVHMIKEKLKIEEGIFDSRTMKGIWKMFNHNIISKLNFKISGGKEADIYLADPGLQIDADLVLLKIFRFETSDFANRVNYMVGDPRFDRIRTNLFEVVNTWCKKEFGNLKIAQTAEIHAPKPYYFNGNVLAMEFLSNGEFAAPPLKDVKLENPDEILDIILEDMRKLYAAEMVHADISEYNILMSNGVPYIIDFGQAVVLEHPRAQAFIERDVYNLLRYFHRKYRIERDEASTLLKITGK